MSLVIERYLMGVKPTGGIIISRQYHLVKIPPLSTLPAVAGDQRISKHHLLRHVWVPTKLAVNKVVNVWRVSEYLRDDFSG